MIINYESKDCILMIIDSKYEGMAKVSMSYLLKYTDFDIVLYTDGYDCTIQNPRIHIRKFEHSSGSQQFNYMNCKPFIVLDMIDNSDYDRVLFLDSDMIFTPRIKDVFIDVKGYLEETPLYPPCPFQWPTGVHLRDANGIVGVEDRLDNYYKFNGKEYSPDRKPYPMWYRMGCAFMFNKACRNFYQDVVCQIKTASSHPEQSKLMKMRPLPGEPDIHSDGSGFQYPINSEEGYVNSTLWKVQTARNQMQRIHSHLPCHVQELYDRKHYDWMIDIQLNLKESQHIGEFEHHPLWQNWVTYVDDTIDHPHTGKWLGIPCSSDGVVVAPISYHFSFLGNKSFFYELHRILGGHDESIFNC